MPQTDHPPLPSTDWDVLISGSGPTHSLLAVALSRAGKAVLQLDKNDYYGSASTAFYTLAELSAWAARVNAGLEAGFASAVLTTTARGDGGALGRGYTLSLAPDLVYWGGELLRVLRAADMADAVSWQAVGGWWVFVTDEEMAVPAPAGAAGGVLVGAGVKAARAVAGGKRRWNKGRKKEGEEAPREAEAEAGAGAEEGAKTTLRRMGRFREVACTFEDVAWSRDLTDRDRGHLGEFLRFVMKHDSRAPSDRKHLDLFTANSETPLQTFLTTTFPLPPPAIASLSSLTLLPTSPASTPLSRALPALARHFRSLGNIPDARSAAALTIAYGGTSELCQVLSRAGAVAGAVNVLARAITAIGPAAAAAAGQRRLTVALDNGEEVAADWVIGAPEDLPASATTTTTTAEAEAQTLSKAVYVLPCELPALFGKKYADEAVTPAVAVLMVPTAPAPGTGTAEKVPVYITARSSVTGECPRGHTLLHATTTLPPPSIDAAVRLLLAESSQPQTTQPLLSLLYTTTTTTAAAAATAGPGVVCLRPVDAGVAFDDGVVREARARFVAVVGGAEEQEERFMRLPDEARRMLEEMEDA